MLKTPFGRRVLGKAVQLKIYVMNHQNVLAYFKGLMAKCNAGLRATSASIANAERGLAFFDVPAVLGEYGRW